MRNCTPESVPKHERSRELLPGKRVAQATPLLVEAAVILYHNYYALDDVVCFALVSAAKCVVRRDSL
jgi:hypothetical protein